MIMKYFNRFTTRRILDVPVITR